MKRSITRILTLCVLPALLVTGCRFGPKHVAPQATIEENWTTSTLLADGEVTRDWWTLFNDPLLNEMVATLQKENLDLKIAFERVRQAQYVATGTAGGLWPTLDAAADMNYTVPGGILPAVGPTGALTLASPFKVQKNQGTAWPVLKWEVDLFGRVAAQVDAADANVEVTQFDAYGVQVSLLGDLGSTYFTLRGRQQQLIAAENEVKLLSDREKIMADRVQKGLDVPSERDSVAAARGRLEADAESIRGEVRTHVYHLATLLGRSPGDMIKLINEHPPLPAVPESVAIGLPSQLAQRRPDVRKAERQLAKATADVRGAIAQCFPQLTLSADIGYELFKLNSLRWDGTAWTMDAQAVSPIFHGGTLLANIDAQRSAAKQASLDYGRTVLVALEEAESALSNFQTAQRREASLREALYDQLRVNAHDRQKEELGLINSVDWIDAQRLVMQSESRYIEAQTNTLVQLVGLFRALGGGWSEPATAAHNQICENKDKVAGL